MSDISDFSNEEIIEKHLSRYSHSPQSQRMRKSCLNYFFGENYFGYKGRVGEVSKADLYDYFDYLNQLESVSLTTKKNKWTILRSFLEFCSEYYDGFVVVFPSKTISWKPTHKEAESNKSVVLTAKEVRKILKWFKKRNFKYYLIFRLFAETGMRKGEIINLEYDCVNIEKRYVKTNGKTGIKVYYISEELRDLLASFVEERKKVRVETKALFLSNQSKKFSERPFNKRLGVARKRVGIEKNVTVKTFRSTLNTLRKLMECHPEDRKILLNHKTGDVNVEHYVKLNYEQFLSLYDKWNPFKRLDL